MSKACWIRSAKGLHGPYDPGLLGKLAEGGLLKPDMEVSTDGHLWHRADTLPGLFTSVPARTAAEPVPSTRNLPPPATPAADTTQAESLAQCIDALPVSNKWKRRFYELEANPKTQRINALALLLCQFYYFAKGMWKKALTLTMWTGLFNGIVIIAASALGFTVHFLFSSAVVGVVFGMQANRDFWRKTVHGETYWPGATARWATWLAIPALIGTLIFTIAFPPLWLDLPSCNDPDARREVLRLIRQSGPMQLDGQSWQADSLADIFEMGRRPLPEYRHCHARLHLKSTAGQTQAHSIEYWVHFDEQGELRIAIN